MAMQDFLGREKAENKGGVSGVMRDAVRRKKNVLC